MAGWQFSRRSQANIARAHPDLRLIAFYMLKHSPYDFIIYDGPRSLEQQRKIVASGASQTLKSRHIVDKANRLHYAFDLKPIVDGKSTWDPEAYLPVLRAAFAGAAKYGIPLDWGGWWEGTSFGKDYAHLAIERDFYPSNAGVSTIQSRAQAGIKWSCNAQTGKYERTLFRPANDPAARAAA